MTVQFCPTCGTLFDSSAEETLRCERCGQTTKNEAFWQVQISTSENFPSALRTRLKSHTQKVTKETVGPGPKIEVECAKCLGRDVVYSQVQLRSADEGSTIFYTCLKCGERWRENN
ncbi:transcription factor S-II-domain-containing protein [Aspergillus coremiiformis]|uniref:DNA-directed RNA polymerase subunit n=1 Tax=Aspergillus coremiiformis TaxID=138285 RepID=A0A5N6Z223_9EURO|nr:transcription factor S-II-domain-containing protein [Aspergillus coremiiformis]